ncbi:hypothetical protein SAMN04487913_104208 [Arthrobacter sp. ok362]|nr:hypothetical protein SAMN04487913_104208 [Arthrobacter sp. ok362]
MLNADIGPVLHGPYRFFMTTVYVRDLSALGKVGVESVLDSDGESGATSSGAYPSKSMSPSVSAGGELPSMSSTPSSFATAAAMST